MKEESLGSLNSYILIILDLLRRSNGRTCARSWQSGVLFWAGWLLFKGQVRIASNETAKNIGHVFLLLKWSPGIVRLDWSGWFMSSYYLDLPCFNMWSDRAVTDVARTQWLAKWGIIEAASDIVFVIFPRVDSPIGEIQNQTWSFWAWDLDDASLGRWKRISNSGFRWL